MSFPRSFQSLLQCHHPISQTDESRGKCMGVLISGTHHFHSHSIGWYLIIGLYLMAKETENVVQLCMRKKEKWFGEQLPRLCQSSIFSALRFHRKVSFFLSKAKPISALDLISPHLLMFLFFFLNFPYQFCIF